MLDRQRLKWAKGQVRGAYRRARNAFVRRFRSYDSPALLQALRDLGLGSGDAVMLHSAYELHHGFRGTVGQVLDVFVEAVGPQGHLLMPSMGYHSALIDYLTRLKSFDVRRSPSTMGLMSEFFRRRPGVVRSAHPAHPILIAGPKAAWFAEGHERCMHSCGPGTPFEKLLEANGKVAFFNVSFAYITFFHFLEHRLVDRLPFRLYHEPPFVVPVVDGRGQPLEVKAMAFSRETLRRRRFAVFESEVRKRGLIRKVRVGATTILLVELRAIVAAVDDMTRRGTFFYDMSASGAST